METMMKTLVNDTVLKMNLCKQLVHEIYDSVQLMTF